MRYSNLIIKYDNRCNMCGCGLSPGTAAHGGKNEAGKWVFRCVECYKKHGSADGDNAPSTPVQPQAPLTHLPGQSARDENAGLATLFDSLGAGDGRLLDEAHLRCTGCGHEIDPDVCCCGASAGGHDDYGMGHMFVPMGCVCGYQKMEPAPAQRREPDPYTMEWIRERAVWGQI